MLRIRELRADEVPLLKDFAPPEWKTDISQIFRRHWGQPYFYPIAAELDGSVVGCASGLVHANAGWLGNVIVQPERRGGGIGRALTQDLVDFFHARKLAHQILVATPLGEPVYRRLGFQIVSYYIFFERQSAAASADADANVRPLTSQDAEAVFALDASVTAEMRRPFVTGYLEGAWVHSASSGMVDGYLLPGLGTGLVIAANDDAGIALMQQKLRLGATASVVPEANTVAADFLRSHGFLETFRAPRMTLGPDVAWQPERVYCRGAGYSG